MSIWLFAAALVAALAVPLRAGERAYETAGRRWTSIPLLNFSSDDGAGYGLRLSLFDYDGRTVPYARSGSAQVFFTSRGKWAHRLYLDIPQWRPGQRLEIEALYEKEDFANYYGSLSDAAVDAYLGEVDEETREQRTTFRQVYPKLKLMWVRTLRAPWRWRAGLQLGRNTITPNAAEGSILRYLDPLGARGGDLFQLNTSLRCDTRDDYHNSAAGVLEEMLVEYSLGRGGDYNGVRFGYEHRHFLSLREGLVLAHRLNADLTFGDVPFYEALELGGSSTVRGLSASRERGEGRLLLNGELRWQGVRLSRRQHLYLGLLLFGDAGQIFARAEGPSLGEWRKGAGAGLRFQWHSTIVRADCGTSSGHTGIYLTFDQVF